MAPSALPLSNPTSIPTSNNLSNTAQTTTSSEPPSTSNPKPSKKRKRKEDQKPHILHQSTIRKPQWSYIHLSLLTPNRLPTAAKSHPSATPTTSRPQPEQLGDTTRNESEEGNLDPLTIHTLLHRPLSQFLGQSGTSISIDILRIEQQDVWIRAPRPDVGAVVGSVGGWVGWVDGGSLAMEEGSVQVGWRVKGKGEWLGMIDDQGGSELFGG